MADIFISYKKEDAGRVDRIVEGLRAEGFSVWWDHAITPGAQWDQTIQQELNAARMVIAVWSDLSVNAPWVKEEAAVGKQKGKLLPVRIDNVEPPLGFGLIQMADLVGWTGDRTKNPQWDHFLASVKALMTGAPALGVERPVRRRAPVGLIIGAVAAALVMIGGGAFACMQLQKVDTVSIDYGDGSSTTIARTPAATGGIVAAPAGPSIAEPAHAGTGAAPSEAESAMFDKAKASRLKADYLDYLRVYPNGAFAEQVRNSVLPFCKQEKEDYWAEQTTGQNIAGSVDKGYATQAAACSAARETAKIYSDTACDALGAGINSRNPKLTVKDGDCRCEQIGDGTWICNTMSAFSCTWEMATFRFIDVCE
jgi:TIR domain